MVIKHDFANVQVAHSDIFWFGLYTPTFSPNYRNYQNTTHLQEKQHSSGQIKASCQSQVHSFPREEGIKFESSEVCITFWQRHILSSWFSSFNPPYLYRPGQNLNQSVLSQPALHFYQSASDTSKQHRSPRGASDQQAQISQVAHVCQRKIKHNL